MKNKTSLDTVYDFQEGQEIFYEFTLNKISFVRDEFGNVVLVTLKDGIFTATMSPELLDMVVLVNPETTEISEFFQIEYDILYKLDKSNLLNMSAIHEFYVIKWIEACKAESDKELDKIYEQACSFTNQIFQKIYEISQIKVDDVRIFR
jgi:hypothetical protein